MITKEEKVTGIAIKNRWTGGIIFQSSKTTYKEAIEEALGKKADLSEADLSEADLSGVNLSGVNLSGVNFSGVNLSKVNLSKANLSGVNLSGVNLSKTDLYEAKFYGRGGTTKIKKSQIDDFFKALGVIVED